MTELESTGVSPREESKICEAAIKAYHSLLRMYKYNTVGIAYISPDWNGPNGVENFVAWGMQFKIPYNWCACKDILGDTQYYSPGSCVPVERNWYRWFYRAIQSYSVYSVREGWQVSCRWGSTYKQPPQLTKAAAEQAWVDEMIKRSEEVIVELMRYMPNPEKRVRALLQRVIDRESEIGWKARDRRASRFRGGRSRKSKRYRKN